MPDSLHQFYFDPNFNVFSVGVFSNLDPTSGTPPTPPSSGELLLLNTDFFGLLNGDTLDLL